MKRSTSSATVFAPSCHYIEDSRFKKECCVLIILTSKNGTLKHEDVSVFSRVSQGIQESAGTAIRTVEQNLTLNNLVFSNSEGKPLDPSTVTHNFGRICKSVGLNVRFHDLRHSCASLMLQQGVHPKIVSEMLGHSTVAITLDIYSHVTPGLQEAAAKSLDSLLPPGMAPAAWERQQVTVG